VTKAHIQEALSTRSIEALANYMGFTTESQLTRCMWGKDTGNFDFVKSSFFCKLSYQILNRL